MVLEVETFMIRRPSGGASVGSCARIVGCSTMPPLALVDRSGFSGTAPIDWAAVESTARMPNAPVGSTFRALKCSCASVGAWKPLLNVPRTATQGAMS